MDNLEHKQSVDIEIEVFKSVMQSGQNAMKSALLINAGATISILTFVTKLFSEGKYILAADLANALLIFTLGVFLAALSTAITYLTQDAASKNKIRSFTNYNRLSIGLIITSLGSFLYASSLIYVLIHSYT